MILAGNIAGDLNISGTLNPSSGASNAGVNSNSASGPLNIANYIGIFAVVVGNTNGASGSITNVYLSTSNDSNVLNVATNSTNYFGTSGAGFTNLSNATSGTVQVLGCDTRALKQYLYLNWLSVAVATNQAFHATVVAQAKYKTS